MCRAATPRPFPAVRWVAWPREREAERPDVATPYRRTGRRPRARAGPVPRHDLAHVGPADPRTHPQLAGPALRPARPRRRPGPPRRLGGGTGPAPARHARLPRDQPLRLRGLFDRRRRRHPARHCWRPGASDVARPGLHVAPLRHRRRLAPARRRRPHQRPRPDRALHPGPLVHRELRRGAAGDRRVGGADGPYDRPRLLHRSLRGARRVRRPQRARQDRRADAGDGRRRGRGDAARRRPRPGRRHTGRATRASCREPRT